MRNRAYSLSVFRSRENKVSRESKGSRESGGSREHEACERLLYRKRG